MSILWKGDRKCEIIQGWSSHTVRKVNLTLVTNIITKSYQFYNTASEDYLKYQNYSRDKLAKEQPTSDFPLKKQAAVTDSILDSPYFSSNIQWWFLHSHKLWGLRLGMSRCTFLCFFFIWDSSGCQRGEHYQRKSIARENRVSTPTFTAVRVEKCLEYWRETHKSASLGKNTPSPFTFTCLWQGKRPRKEAIPSQQEKESKKLTYESLE